MNITMNDLEQLMHEIRLIIESHAVDRITVDLEVNQQAGFIVTCGPAAEQDDRMVH
jgi:hypothetical protein